MSISEIHPHVRVINLYQCQPGFDSLVRKQYDHYFLYVHSGKGRYIIRDREHHALPGHLFFLPPATNNQIIADTEDPFLLSGIGFDFSQNHKDNQLRYSIMTEYFNPAYLTEFVTFLDFEGFPEVTPFFGDPGLQTKILDMAYQMKTMPRFYQLSVNGIFQSVLVSIIRHVLTPANDRAPKSRQEEIIRYITNHYKQSITNESIANVFNYHPDHINKLVYAYTNMTIRNYIINLRIREATNLLVNTNRSIDSIAHAVGYDNAYYFSRLYKAKTGSAPSHLRSRYLTTST